MDRKALLTDYVKNEIMRNRNAVVEENQDLLGSGILDSLGILQLIAHIGEVFGIDIPDEDVVYDNFMSISAIDNYLQKNSNARA
jgi:acyl carrier protein